MSHQTYKDIGPVTKTVSRYADQFYNQKLNETEQKTAQHIFMQLVKPSDDPKDTTPKDVRRVASRANLADYWSVVQRLADARLVVTNRIGVGSETVETVELVHEVLIREWEKLQEWLNEDRPFRIWQERLRTQIASWEASGKNEGALLRDKLLAEAEKWLTERPLDLNQERDFIEQSIVLRKRVEHRQKNLRTASVVVAIAMFLLAIFATYNMVESMRQNRIVEGQYLALQAQMLAEVPPSGQPLPFLLALKAKDLTEGTNLTPVDSALRGLINASYFYNNKILDEVNDYQNSWFYPSSVAYDYAHTNYSRNFRGLIYFDNWMINTVAYSPDGHWLTSTGFDYDIQLRDLTQPTAVPQLLSDHETRIWTMVFSPDSHWLASIGFDNKIHLWDLTRPITASKVLSGHENWVTTITFSPDSKWLASTGFDATIRLWDLTNLTSKPVILSGHQDWVNSIAFTSDGHWLASASRDKSIRLWDLSDPTRKSQPLLNHKNWATLVAFSPDNHWLASISSATRSDGIELWDMTKPITKPKILSYHNGGITTMIGFSPNGHLLASVSGDIVYLWDLNQLAMDPQVLSGHRDSVSFIAFSPDNQWLASASRDETIRLWDMRQPSNKSWVLSSHTSEVVSVTFSPDSRHLLSQGLDAARIWDLTLLQTQPEMASRVLDNHNYPASVMFSPDGHWLVSLSYYDTLRLWNMSQLELEPKELTDFRYDAGIPFFTPDSRWLIGVKNEGSDNTSPVLIDMNQPDNKPRKIEGEGVVLPISDGLGGWDVVRKQITGLETVVPSALVFDLTTKLLIAGNQEGVIRIWDTSKEETEPWELFDHKGPVTTLAFNSKNHLLASGGDDTSIHLWDIGRAETEPWLLSGPKGPITYLIFSPDGRWLAAKGVDAAISLWDINHPESEPQMLLGHEGPITSLTFSLDSRWLASGSQDTTIRLWDMSNPQVQPIVLLGHTEAVTSLDFSPDGRWLVSGGKEIRLWLTPEGLVDVACQRAGRNLTLEEQMRYLPSETWLSHLLFGPYKPPCDFSQ